MSKNIIVEDLFDSVDVLEHIMNALKIEVPREFRYFAETARKDVRIILKEVDPMNPYRKAVRREVLDHFRSLEAFGFEIREFPDVITIKLPNITTTSILEGAFK